MEKIKICIVTLEFPPDTGGVGQSVHRIGKMLETIGYEVHVVVFHSRQSKEQMNFCAKRGFNNEVLDGLFVHRYRAALKCELNSLTEFLSDISMELNLLHEQHHFDLLHAFFINETGLLTTLLAKELGLPVINSIRGSDLHKNIFNARHFGKILWTLENSSWLTFVSQDLEHRAQVLVPSICGKTSAFWNSIEPIDFANFPRPETNYNLNGIVIGTVGRFRDKKGIDYLIQACNELKHELDFTLLMIGDFIEKEQSYWQYFIQNCGIKDKIVITGLLSRDETLKHYPLMDIFVMPSLRDGCPNAMLEAMLAGNAIIGTRVDAIGEILEHNVNGKTVRPSSVKELKESIRELAVNHELRKKLGAAARRTAIEKLSPEIEQANWVTIYNRVLKSKTSPSQKLHVLDANHQADRHVVPY